jgi:hypothetical protein
LAKLILSGDTSGSVTLESPAVSGTTTLTLPTTTDTLVGKTTTDTLTNKTLTSPVIDGTPTGVGVLTAGTSVSASGTSVDFTSIPSWVKRITVMLSGVSTNGSSPVQVQLGDAGGIENTGYIGSVATISGGVANFAFSAGFLISSSGGEAATTVRYGSLIISKINNNLYTAIGNFSYGSTDTRFFVLAGNKDLSDTLDRVRITTVNGTDAFDAGSINILFE